MKGRLDLTIVHVLENPPEGWTGERGSMTAAVFKRHLPPAYANHEYFICGPGVMMDAIEKSPRRRFDGPAVEVPLRRSSLRLGAAMRRLLPIDWSSPAR